MQHGKEHKIVFNTDIHFQVINERLEKLFIIWKMKGPLYFCAVCVFTNI